MGIKESSLAQAIVTTVNICGMLFIIIVGGYLAFKTGWIGYELPSGYFPLGLNGMLGGSAVVFFSFIGFDVVASTAEEVRTRGPETPGCEIVFQSPSLKLRSPVLQLGENEILSIDMRPSDAINVANKCKAPIHVSKQIVFTDAIRISYGMGRVHDRKTTYDVSLDSPADGPDSLSEELDIVKNMNLAIQEERYGDAAMWRDKLMELRQSSHEQ